MSADKTGSLSPADGQQGVVRTVALSSDGTLSSADLDQLNSNRKIVRNGALSVEVIVNGDSGPLLVLLPSWGRDSEEFAPLAEKMTRAGFRVLRPVPRGMGATNGPITNITMHDLARDVVAVIEAEAAGPAVVAGHAFGTYLARATAALRPDLVSGVALLGAGHKGPAKSEIVEAVLKSGDMSLPEAERLTYLKRVFFAPGNDPSIWLTGWHANVSKACGSAFQTPQEEYWQAGGKPILDLIAASDPLRPSESYEDIRGDLGSDRVTVVIVPNASHALVLEQPDIVAEALLKFARRIHS